MCLVRLVFQVHLHYFIWENGQLLSGWVGGGPAQTVYDHLASSSPRFMTLNQEQTTISEPQTKTVRPT